MLHVVHNSTNVCSKHEMCHHPNCANGLPIWAQMGLGSNGLGPRDKSHSLRLSRTSPPPRWPEQLIPENGAFEICASEEAPTYLATSPTAAPTLLPALRPIELFIRSLHVIPLLPLHGSPSSLLYQPSLYPGASGR